MARETFVFDNFSLGDTGREAPMTDRYGRRKMLRGYGHWKGLNVMRYPSGAVGPRPALKLYTSTAINGNVKFVVPNAYTGAIVVVTTTNRVYVYYNGSWTAAGTTTQSEPVLGGAAWGDAVYLTHGSPGVVATSGTKVDTDAGTLTNIVGLASGVDMTPYRDFMVVARNTTIYWCRRQDPTLWTGGTAPDEAGNMQIGGPEEINRIFTLRNTLVVAKQGGEWWTVTGDLNGTPTVRRADQGLEALKGMAGRAVQQSSVWFTNGRNAAVFNGAQLETELLPDFDTSQGIAPTHTRGYTALSELDEPNSFALLASNSVSGTRKASMFVRHNRNGWSRHSLPITVGAETLPAVTHTTSLAGATFDPVQDHALYVFGQTSGTLKVYRWNPRQETPYTPGGFNPFTEDVDGEGSCGDVVSGTFSSPEFWTPEGDLVHVHGLVVDYSYDYEAIARALAVNPATLPSAVCAFTVGVEALNIEDDGSRSSTTQALTLPTAAATATTTSYGYSQHRARAPFRFGDQGAGGGFRINFTGLKGVLIHRIIVVADFDVATLF